MKQGDVIQINKRNYTVQRLDGSYTDRDGTLLETWTLVKPNGEWVRAQFYNGAFDVWDNPTKSRKSTLSRVNMRSSKYSKYGK